MPVSDVRMRQLLIVGENSYAIKHAGYFAMPNANNASFVKMASVSATITKQPFSSSTVETPETVWTGYCLPLDPVSQAVQQRVNLKTPSKALQTEIADGDGYAVMVVEDIL